MISTQRARTIEDVFLKIFLEWAFLGSLILFLYDLLIREAFWHNLFTSGSFCLITVLGLILDRNDRLTRYSTAIIFILISIILFQDFFIPFNYAAISFTIVITLGFLGVILFNKRTRSILHGYIAVGIICLILYHSFLSPFVYSDPIELFRFFIPFFVFYIIIIKTATYLKKAYHLRGEKLEIALEAIRENEKMLSAQNELLLNQKNELASLNEFLTSSLSDKTQHILDLNRHLVTVAFKNAHHIRGPIARILGLIQLIKMETKSQERYINYILEEAQSADLLVKRLNDEIQEYISYDSESL